MTVIAADATPTDPLSVTCLDINMVSGCCLKSSCQPLISLTHGRSGRHHKTACYLAGSPARCPAIERQPLVSHRVLPLLIAPPATWRPDKMANMCAKACLLLTKEVVLVLLQGQRYDVLLTANQPVDNYWLSALVQYRTGSPAGYAVISYAGEALTTGCAQILCYAGAAKGSLLGTPSLEMLLYVP